MRLWEPTKSAITMFKEMLPNYSESELRELILEDSPKIQLAITAVMATYGKGVTNEVLGILIIPF